MGENQQFKVDSIKLMDKIIERFDLLTSAEKRVCNFIVENRDKVICMHINDLAEKTFTSKTVVINMAKRLGFAGYA
ncbi:MurR/RpiR family transcriptional regulator, partial [Solobacterium moorei]|uniref:MurR/RpiR family transcriptional regulator n=1 Tax=Solobacterium moorei TaxID=102148 RepID=UPI0037DA62F9